MCVCSVGRVSYALCVGSAGARLADADATKIDVLAVLAFGTSAAGEFGHRPLKRGRTGIGKPLRLAGRDRDCHNKRRRKGCPTARQK
jgi:hypothetical protein